jgi:hypothetical protein
MIRLEKSVVLLGVTLTSTLLRTYYIYLNIWVEFEPRASMIVVPTAGGRAVFVKYESEQLIALNAVWLQVKLKYHIWGIGHLLFAHYKWRVLDRGFRCWKKRERDRSDPEE